MNVILGHDVLRCHDVVLQDSLSCLSVTSPVHECQRVCLFHGLFFTRQQASLGEDACAFLHLRSPEWFEAWLGVLFDARHPSPRIRRLVCVPPNI